MLRNQFRKSSAVMNYLRNAPAAQFQGWPALTQSETWIK